MKKKFVLTALLFVPLLLHAITIHIKNDTTTTLIATIYDKKEKVMSVSMLSPGQHYYWMDTVTGGSNNEERPFTVVFTCKNGDTYGTVKHVNDNFQVNARSARGSKRCGK